LTDRDKIKTMKGSLDKKTIVIIGLACIPIAGAIFLSSQGQKVILCPFRAITGLPCPFCGTTRATLFLLQGNSQFFDYNYFWIFALPIVALLLLNKKVRNFFTGKRAIIAGSLLIIAGWAVAFSNFSTITS